MWGISSLLGGDSYTLESNGVLHKGDLFRVERRESSTTEESASISENCIVIIH